MKTKPLTFLLALTFLFLFSGSSVVFADDWDDAVANDADVDRVTKRHGVAARLFVGMHLNVVLGVSHSIVALDVEYGVRR